MLSPLANIIRADVTVSLSDPPRRAWVDVDLAALARNARRVANTSGAPLLPMVKANGYGLGAVTVARSLETLDPWGYGVATPEEGAELRAAGIVRPILVVTPCPPSWQPAVLAAGLTPTLADAESVRAWLARSGGRPFHVAIDTGMARGGFRADSPGECSALATLLRGAEGYEGISTHFHSADELPASADEQWTAFQRAVNAVGRPRLVHAANSAAALRDARFGADLVRPGIFLYGGNAGGQVPEPVARFRARVVTVQELPAGRSVSYGATWTAPGPVRVGILGAGYADGLHRSLSSRGLVELNGQLAPIRGRITMDMTMIEVPPSAKPDDVATVFGGLVTLDQQAELAGTISYELLTSLGRRVERCYQGAA